MSTSSTSSYYSPLAGKIPTSPGCSAISVKVAKLLDHTNTWKIVPQWYMDQRPQNPASVYGAVHLARLFGKILKKKINSDSAKTKNKSILYLQLNYQTFCTLLINQKRKISQGYYQKRK